MSVQNYVYVPAESTKPLYGIARSRSRGVKERKALAYGKHFYSFQTCRPICRFASNRRRPFEAQGRVSPSADGDLRNFLKKVP